jgi:hypothetical protein
MTPAALHRLTYGGEDTDGFLILGSAFVIAAPAPLAVAIGGDLYVAISKASNSPFLGVTLAATSSFWRPSGTRSRWRFGITARPGACGAGGRSRLAGGWSWAKPDTGHITFPT